VERIYKIKQREENKSMIVILHSEEQLQEYVEKVPPVAFDLMKKIDTPLTIIYPGAKNLAKNVIADDNTIAIRIVKYEFCRQMLSSFGKAVVSTSANLSGEQPPLVFSRISRQVIDGVDYAVNYDRDRMNLAKPSTIIKIENSGEFRIIRN
jgi:L-threonylcarbamoyladenylate synthase